jgi:hypothetical protein
MPDVAIFLVASHENHSIVAVFETIGRIIFEGQGQGESK